MEKFDQSKAPYVEALGRYSNEDIVPFDVPGHHMGNISNPAVSLLGRHVYRLDVNAPIGLDNLAHPSGVLKEAEDYCADAMGADHAFFLINGTSSGIIAMILTACKAGETIILPRNVHKSIINALILSGAVPVYLMPEIDEDLEIANQPSLEQYQKAIQAHPSAKAIFVINPTYFGAVGNLRAIVELAHAHGMGVLVDEAHGAHYYFHASGSPLTAMDAGADMSSVSMHKTAGSLTGSSVLLMKGDRYSPFEIQRSLNIINTTSPSGLLIASLDGARQFMATKGKQAQEETYKLAEYAESQINGIPGFRVCGKSHFLAHGCFDFDRSKLVIALDSLDINGFQLYQLGMAKYKIQFELAETYAVLCIFAIGTKKEHVDRLVASLREVSKEHYHPEMKFADHHFDNRFPYAFIRPRIAFHAAGMLVRLEDCADKISKEQVMLYPPGIPLICPGEVWTKELVERVASYRKEGVKILSTYPDEFEVVDQAKWRKFPLYQRRFQEYITNRRTTPSSDGYSMPFEGGPHKATVILWPFRSDTWREKAAPGREAFAQVVKAIARFEPVIVGVHPSLPPSSFALISGVPNVTVIRVRYNDSWARDNMPLFVKKGSSLRGVDFRFNAWGGNVDGLYANYHDDDKLSSVFCRRYKIPDYYLPSFVLEGGSIAVDGEGTCIVTEACLLSKGRNPTLSKEEIEETLKSYLGVTKVIWIPHGIVEDETNEHIDNMVAFVRPGVLALAWCQDENDLQAEYSKRAFQILSQEKDAAGRSFEIIKLDVPNPVLRETPEEAKGIKKGGYDAKPRPAEARLAASYVNFYQGEKFVIMPGFGVKEDALAKEKLQKAFPEKEVIQLNTREILLGGGNVHCITMQIPEVK